MFHVTLSGWQAIDGGTNGQASETALRQGLPGCRVTLPLGYRIASVVVQSVAITHCIWPLLRRALFFYHNGFILSIPIMRGIIITIMRTPVRYNWMTIAHLAGTPSGTVWYGGGV